MEPSSRALVGRIDELEIESGVLRDNALGDEWYLDNGAVAVSRELDAIGVSHTLELFDAGHMGINYRYPLSLAFLARALSEPI